MRVLFLLFIQFILHIGQRFVEVVQPRVQSATLSVILAASLISVMTVTPAWAGFDDDRFDGNIFALYGSNGGMIPPRVTLSESLQREKPALVVFYIDDSRDCKQYAPAIANLQTRYSIGVNFIAYPVDLFFTEDPDNISQYYTGRVPQTLLFDSSGDIVYDSVGKRPIEEVENAIRALFDLEPVDKIEVRAANEIQQGFDR